MFEKNKLVLYHGTISQIEHIDVKRGRGNKDFGKGFYMAVSRQQAIGMMHKKYKEAVRRSRNKKNLSFEERHYEITLDKKYLETITIKQFETADQEWLDFVLLCRENGGKVGSSQAKTILLNNLEPENLGIQYYVGKQMVVDRLISSMKEIQWR